MKTQQTQIRQIPQIEQIENHLLVHKKITSWKAITTYGITRLSSYIETLKNKRNWDIEPVWKYKKDCRGKITKKWTEYQLKNYPNS